MIEVEYCFEEQLNKMETFLSLKQAWCNVHDNSFFGEITFIPFNYYSFCNILFDVQFLHCPTNQVNQSLGLRCLPLTTQNDKNTLNNKMRIYI